MRILNIFVIVALVLAAAYVYEIKFQSTLKVERVAKLRSEIRRERDAIAALRAEWAKLDNPARLQGLARRHLALKPTEAHQFDTLDRLPDKPPVFTPVDEPDSIGAMIEYSDGEFTGSVPAEAEAKANEFSR